MSSRRPRPHRTRPKRTSRSRRPSRKPRPKSPRRPKNPSPKSLLPSPSPSPKSPRLKRRIALTGGIGAGKSEALKAFERGGAAVCSSDEIVHRLIAEDPEVRAALEERFGSTDRARIAETVFADHAELEWLERLLHPRVRAASAAWLEGLADSVDVPVVG